MGTTEIYLIALTIILAAPYLVWRLLRTEHWAPLVVVQIIGGILLGPGVLGHAAPDFHALVFNPQVMTALNGVAWWAVMMFVFVAGVELDLSDAWKHRGETTLTAACALLTRSPSAPSPLRCCCVRPAGSAPKAAIRKPCSAWAWPAPSPPCRSWCC